MSTSAPARLAGKKLGVLLSVSPTHSNFRPAVALMNAQDAIAAAAVAAEHESIAKAIDLVVTAFRSGGRSSAVTGPCAASPARRAEILR